MKWALVDQDGNIQNIIVYDGVTQYTPPTGLTVYQANNWLEIGSHIDDPDPNI